MQLVTLAGSRRKVSKQPVALARCQFKVSPQLLTFGRSRGKVSLQLVTLAGSRRKVSKQPVALARCQFKVSPQLLTFGRSRGKVSLQLVTLARCRCELSPQLVTLPRGFEQIGVRLVAKRADIGQLAAKAVELLVQHQDVVLGLAPDSRCLFPEPRKFSPRVRELPFRLLLGLYSFGNPAAKTVELLGRGRQTGLKRLVRRRHQRKLVTMTVAFGTCRRMLLAQALQLCSCCLVSLAQALQLCACEEMLPGQLLMGRAACLKFRMQRGGRRGGIGQLLPQALGLIRLLIPLGPRLIELAVQRLGARQQDGFILALLVAARLKLGDLCLCFIKARTYGLVCLSQRAGFERKGLHCPQQRLQRHGGALAHRRFLPAAQRQDGAVDVFRQAQGGAQLAASGLVVAEFRVDEFGQGGLKFMVGALPHQVEFVSDVLGQRQRIVEPRLIGHHQRPVPPGIAQDVVIVGQPHDFRLGHRYGPVSWILLGHRARRFGRMAQRPHEARADVEFFEDLAPQRQQTAGSRVLEAPRAPDMAEMLGQKAAQLFLQRPDLDRPPPARGKRHRMGGRIHRNAKRCQDFIMDRHDIWTFPEARFVFRTGTGRLVDHVDAEQMQDIGEKRRSAPVHTQHDDDFAALRAAAEVAAQLQRSRPGDLGGDLRGVGCAHGPVVTSLQAIEQSTTAPSAHIALQNL